MTKNTEWSHLLNAVHIDRVLASLKAHPEAWAAAWDAAKGAARTVAWYQARDAAWASACRAAWKAAIGKAAWDEAREAAWVAAGDAAGYAVLALVAWDNSAKFLDMNSNELKMWGALSEDPAAILLLPAVIAFEQIAELELA